MICQSHVVASGSHGMGMMSASYCSPCLTRELRLMLFFRSSFTVAFVPCTMPALGSTSVNMSPAFRNCRRSSAYMLPISERREYRKFWMNAAAKPLIPSQTRLPAAVSENGMPPLLFLFLSTAKQIAAMTESMRPRTAAMIGPIPGIRKMAYITRATMLCATAFAVMVNNTALLKGLTAS